MSETNIKNPMEALMGQSGPLQHATADLQLTLEKVKEEVEKQTKANYSIYQGVTYRNNGSTGFTTVKIFIGGSNQCIHVAYRPFGEWITFVQTGKTFFDPLQ